MARSYEVFGDNLAAQNSATVPQAQIVATAAVRLKLYDLMIGSPSTPADQAASWVIKRTSTASTGGTAVTPSPIDIGDPASSGTAMVAPSMSAPTLSVVVLAWAQNLRATFRWVSAPGKEITTSASTTTTGSLTLLNTVLTGAFNVTFSFAFEE